MKKMCILFLCFIFVLTGCSSKSEYPIDDIYHFETDSQYTFCNQGKERKFAQSEDGYYFALTLQGNHFLFFTDKETMETVSVCSKPNCLHYAETDDGRRQLCNAFFYGLFYHTSVYYNNEKLYLPTKAPYGGTPILEISPDGTSRRELFQIDSEALRGTELLFHRGYCYTVINAYDENQNHSSKLLQYSLDKPQAPPDVLLEWKEEKNAYTRALDVSELTAYGNHMYFSAFEEGDRHFYTIDLNHKDKEPQRICELDNAGIRYNFVLLENRPLVAYNDDDPRFGQELPFERLPSTMYRASELDGSNLQEWKTFDYSPFTADDRYLYRWSFAPAKERMEEMYIRIYDGDGNLLVEYDALETLPDMYDLYVSPGEHVFITSDANDTVWYFSKSEIETGTITPKLLIDCSAYATGS